MDNVCDNFFNYNEVSFTQAALMLFSFVPLAFSIPCCIVSKFIYEPMLKQSKKDEAEWKMMLEESKKETPFEDKYPLKDISGGVVRVQNIIIEDSPDGNIAMRYNKDTEAFEYWCDNDVKYIYLETIARKYVNMFGCTEIYIDRKKHLDEKIKKLTEEIEDNKNKKLELEETTKNEQIIDDDVFIKLKKYNNTLNEKTKEKTRLTKDDYVCDIANKYIKKGKFDDDKGFIDNSKILPSENKDISWGEWTSTN